MVLCVCVKVRVCAPVSKRVFTSERVLVFTLALSLVKGLRYLLSTLVAVLFVVVLARQKSKLVTVRSEQTCLVTR